MLNIEKSRFSSGKTKTFFILICSLLLCLPIGNILIAQNINTTLGSLGVFTIKDASNNFFTLSQSTGQVNVLKTLRLENTTNSTTGVIYFGDYSFIHTYGGNTFIGINSGNFTLTGALNTAVGTNSFVNNSSGSYNTAVGQSSLLFNTTGNYNTTVGYSSLLSNTIGFRNTAVGTYSLNYNSTGYNNTAVGESSLYRNTTGYNNTAVGEESLWNNTTGYYNTAVGLTSLNQNTTGSNNTAIGYFAQVPSGTSSNQVRIGNTSITYAGIQVPWTITSDRRWKSDIQNSALGLGFISKLRPVSYFRNNDESKKTEYGFIAQEVEEVLKESGTENTGMITVTDEGMYELRYNDMLAPMVKAIQELKSEKDGEIAELKTENDELKDKLAKFEKMQNLLVSEIEKLKSNKIDLKEVKLTGK